MWKRLAYSFIASGALGYVVMNALTYDVSEYKVFHLICMLVCPLECLPLPQDIPSIKNDPRRSEIQSNNKEIIKILQSSSSSSSPSTPPSK